MARPEMRATRQVAEEFLRKFISSSKSSAIPLPEGFDIDALAHCALARYRCAAEYAPEIMKYIDAIAMHMHKSS